MKNDWCLVKNNSEYPTQPISFYRKFIDAIYPQKLVFDNGTYRTTKINLGIAFIALINKSYVETKMGKN